MPGGDDRAPGTVRRFPAFALAVVLAGALGLAACTSTSPEPTVSTPAPASTASSPTSTTTTPPATPTTPATPTSPPLGANARPDAVSACEHLPLDPLGGSRPALLDDLDLAAEATVAQLQAAAGALDAVSLGLVSDGTGGMVGTAVATGPVVLADVALDRDGAGTATLDVDMVLALPSVADTVVLRTLAVTDATRPVRATRVSVTASGEVLDVDLQPGLDRVMVDLGDGRAGQRGDAIVLRVGMQATVPDTTSGLVANRGPASYGLFSDQGDLVALGHWLPVPVAVPGNDGDVPPWGDLGAFAPAAWLVDITVPSGFVQTGAVDLRAVDADGDAVAGRQSAIGLGLRDLAAVWTTDEGACGPGSPRRGTSATGVFTAWAGTTDPASGDDGQPGQVREETAAMAALSQQQLAWLAEMLGRLPWPEHDLVRVDMDTAAGMEFPGLVMVDTAFWNTRGELGEYVLIHEWAHQYFHALVGNGSLSDPVVDEPLAQYLSWRWYLDEYGQAAAAAVYRNAIQPPDPPPEDPPGQPAGGFSDHAAYSAAIYRVAADAWVTAANDHGVEVVDEVVRALVDRHALGAAIAESDVVAVARAVSPAVADDLAAAFAGDG